MKKISLFAVICLFAHMAMAQQCVISGRINDPKMDGKKVYLINMNTGITLDSARISDNAFTIATPVSKPFVGFLKTESLQSKNNYYYLRFIAESGLIHADLVTDSLSGTPHNDRFYQIEKDYKYEFSVLRALTSQMENVLSRPANETKALAEEISMQEKNTRKVLWMAYNENKHNPIGALVMEDYLDWVVNYEQAKDMLQDADSVIITYKRLEQRMSAMERLSHTAVGKPYRDLNLIDYKTGKTVKLSQYAENKVVLVDFWASWCRPCRKEIPNIAKIHEQYGKRKDFVVISLNVWDKPEPQAKAIKDMNMKWTQLTDRTNNATNTYGVDGIPQILLIGKDGIIIARDLRSEDIEAAVKKALN